MSWRTSLRSSGETPPSASVAGAASKSHAVAQWWFSSTDWSLYRSARRPRRDVVPVVRARVAEVAAERREQQREPLERREQRAEREPALLDHHEARWHTSTQWVHEWYGLAWRVIARAPPRGSAQTARGRCQQRGSAGRVVRRRRSHRRVAARARAIRHLDERRAPRASPSTSARPGRPRGGA